MISNQSLKHFKYLLDTAQVLQRYRVHIFPFQCNLQQTSVEFVPRINSWRIMSTFNIFVLTSSILTIVLGLILSQAQDVAGFVVAIWILTCFLAFLGFQIHLQIHYQEVLQWLNTGLLMNLNLSTYAYYNYQTLEIGGVKSKIGKHFKNVFTHHKS